MSSEHYYQEIPAGDVDPGKRLAAERALAHVEGRLGLPHIVIRWVREISKTTFNLADTLAELGKASQALGMVVGGRPDYSVKKSTAFIDEGGFGGKVHPISRQDMIYVNADQPESRICFIVGHECKHLADHRVGYRPYTPEQAKAMEGRADTFGREIERQFRGG